MYNKNYAVNYLQIKILLLCASLQNLSLMGDGFAAGTLVTTPEGLRPIELLQPDQKVLCVSSQGKIIEQPLIALQRISAHELIEVIIGNTAILMSPRQRVYVHSRNAWTTAEMLEIGDMVKTVNGSLMTITAVARKNIPCTLYAPTIRKCHNLFVSPHSILAHNAVIGGIVLSAAALTIIKAISYTITAMVIAKKMDDILGEQQLREELEELAADLEDEVGPLEEDYVGDICEEMGDCEEDDEELKEKIIRFTENKIKEEDETPAKTVEEILEDAKLIRKTDSKTKIFEKEGGYAAAKEDFDSLQPTDVSEINTGEVGILTDGRKAIVRTKSSDERITLEIQSPTGKSLIKIRYN